VLGDRGYDHDKYRRLVRVLGVKPLIARRGTEHGSGLGTRRWVVERVFAHLRWFRRLRIRWEIRDDIHEAFLIPRPSRTSMSSRRIDEAGISARYGVSPKDAAVWTTLVNFPAAGEDGLRDAALVDAWVQAMRPQYWPPRQGAASAGGATSPRKGEPKGSAVIPAPVTEARSEMAKRFGMTFNAVDAWTKATERRDTSGKVVAAAFPTPVSEGWWDVKEVDEWVRVWAAYVGGEPRFAKPLPAGDPKDLLNISEYGVIRGNAISGKPALRRTMQSYLLRGQIAAPDRRPGDRKRPEVFEPMRYRETVYREIRQRLTRGNPKADEKTPTD
jgi:transposase